MVKFFYIQLAFLFCISFILSSSITKGQCSDADKPAFGFTFNGIPLADVNNGSPDSGESASFVVCDKGSYTVSDYFYSSYHSLYNVVYSSTGSTVLINGSQPLNNVTPSLFYYPVTNTVSFSKPDTAGILIETITPFTDLNDNRTLDSGDCAGDPIMLTFTVMPKPTWYLDADGDHHAFQSTRSCTNPGIGWTLTPLPVDDCNDSAADSCTNKRPVVNLTNPAKFTGYSASFPIQLSADASDADGSIRSVAFYSNGALIFTDSTAPYSGVWKSVPHGDYSITAVATDNTGFTTTSLPVHIRVYFNLPPSVQITSPAAESTFYGAPVNIVVSAEARANGAKIKNVKFYNRNKLIHTEENPPYLWTWKNVPPGSYLLHALTTDSYGRGGGSPYVHFSVAQQRCDSASKPTFSYILNGTKVSNINNGITDPSETGNVSVCNGGRSTKSGLTYSDSTNLYEIIAGTGGNNTVLFNGTTYNGGVETAAKFARFESSVKLTLADPSLPGYAYRTITPFKDLNHDGALDAGDCAGDPVNETFIVGDCTNTCTYATAPEFGFNLNGDYVYDGFVGYPDPGEAVSVTFCDGQQYFTSGYFYSNPSNLYKVAITDSGGTLLFDGHEDTSRIITGAALLASAGNHIITLAKSGAEGKVTETITPFTNFNNNGLLDSADCTGDAVVLTYTVASCLPANESVINHMPVDKSSISSVVHMQLLPNPAKSVLNIRVTGLQQNERSTISVISTSGVTMKTVQALNSNQDKQVNISSLTNGVYIVKLVSGKKVVYRQFVKM